MIGTEIKMVNMILDPLLSEYQQEYINQASK